MSGDMMKISHHPSDETLAAFAGGEADLARRLVIASHLERCPACRRFVRGLEQVGGVMLEDQPATPLAVDALTKTLARLDSAPGPAPVAAPAGGESDLPACLSPYERGAWRWVGLGVQYQPILLPEAPGARLFLLKARPGTQLPQHTHTGNELTLILTGAFAHEGGRFGPGDIEDADDSIEHRPVVEPGEECICLVALDGRLKLSGLLGTLLNPFVRL